MYKGLTIKHLNILKKVFQDNDVIKIYDNYQKSRDFILQFWIVSVFFDVLKRNLVDKIVFDVIPRGYITPTRTLDEYRSMLNSVVPKKRKEAQDNLDYFEFKQNIYDILKNKNWVGKETLTIFFYIPMPDGWDERKKKMMNLKPCSSKPDYHSLLKGFLYATYRQDSPLSDVRIVKKWAYKGKIEVYE